MSEFKGQLLGLIIVISVFGAIGGILVSAFKNSATAISDKIGAADTLVAGAVETDATENGPEVLVG